jgi:hypothetical protein
MNSRLKSLGAVAWTVLALLGGPGPAAAQQAAPQALLHQVIQDLNLVQVIDTGIRTSHFAATGQATFPSPFCPQELADQLKALGLNSGDQASCTVTVDGHDTICVISTCTIGDGPPLAILQGGLDADIAIVVAFDNVVEAPDAVVMTGHITVPLGQLQGVPFGTPPAVLLEGKLSAMGPAVPLFFMTGTFTPLQLIGPAPGGGLELQAAGLDPSDFSATFRSPFRLTKAGHPDKPVRGHHAFYLADNGDVIRIEQDEFSLGVPTLRAEVTFPSVPPIE